MSTLGMGAELAMRPAHAVSSHRSGQASEDMQPKRKRCGLVGRRVKIDIDYSPVTTIEQDRDSAIAMGRSLLAQMDA